MQLDGAAPVLTLLWFLLLPLLLILPLRGKTLLWSVAEQGVLPPRRQTYPRSARRHPPRFDTRHQAACYSATGEDARR